nr:MAG TPA: transposase [Caudoviricetes sp.]
MSRKATQEYCLSQWLPVIKECKASDMTVKSWCQQNNVNEKQFYYWQRQLRTIARQSLPVTTQQSQFVPISLPNKPTYSEGFIPTMVIRVGHTAIELSEQVQPELLSSILKVLADVQ